MARFSEHSLQLLNSCPLKYELLRNHDLGTADDYQAEDMNTNPNIDYGKAIGEGFQELLRSKDLDAAIYAAFCAYGFWEDDKKCWEGIVAALQQLKKNFPLDLFTLVLKEASIRVNLNEDGSDYWCGFVDGILYREDTKKYIVGEIKSCGQSRADLSPLYQNAGQALGYSVVLPEIIKAPGDYDVLYIVAHVPGQRWFPEIKTYIFEKTRLDRLKWLLTLQLDYERYCTYRELQIFPARGQSCLAYNRPCSLFGICNTLVPCEFPPRPNDHIDDMVKEDWDIYIPLQTLIEHEVGND